MREFTEKEYGEDLIKRWIKLRYHRKQAELWLSKARFNIVPAGRRSGKTELCGKRKVILKAFRKPGQRIFAAAPTRDQAKRIYWNDLKMMIPSDLILGRPKESSLIISIINGSEIHVLGMDKPERIEGTPWDHGVLDEFGNMKPETWSLHVRPALADRNGTCDFIGVPEGRNHYYELHQKALEDKTGNWAVYHWLSADILPADEIEQAKRDLDLLSYQQEFEGSFVNFVGMAYYNYSDKLHQGRLEYNPRETLEFCFDFNVSPGCAVVMQLQNLPKPSNLYGSGIIGEVWIPKNSNTIRVCDELIEDWGDHKGKIICYGDASGGAKGTAKIMGSDWQLIKQKLRGHFGEDRVFFKVPKANPKERDRINSVNSRLKSINGEIRLMVDPIKAPHVMRDFEGTMLKKNGSGEIDKKKDLDRSHLTDGIGYHIYREWPIGMNYKPSGEKYWK